jgi:hypothetical protein
MHFVPWSSKWGLMNVLEEKHDQGRKILFAFIYGNRGPRAPSAFGQSRKLACTNIVMRKTTLKISPPPFMKPDTRNV